MFRPSFCTTSLACLSLLAARAGSRYVRRQDGLKSFNATLLHQLPHIDKPFTQGLEFDAQKRELVETSGAFPQGTRSYIRGVDPQSGKTNWITQEGFNGGFAEGIVQNGPENHWFTSLYNTGRLLEYDSSMKYVHDHPYYYEGWGLTASVDGSSFLATNGSTQMMTLAPDTLELVNSKPATCMGKDVPKLNELEMVRDFFGPGRAALIGNIYTTRMVLIMDPQTMDCIGVLDLSGLPEPIIPEEALGYHVANGIAYNPYSGTFFVTGKNWEYMFEIRIQEDETAAGTLELLDNWLGAQPQQTMLLQAGASHVQV